MRWALLLCAICAAQCADNFTFEFSAFVYVNTTEAAVTANAPMYLDMLCDALRKSNVEYLYTCLLEDIKFVKPPKGTYNVNTWLSANITAVGPDSRERATRAPDLPDGMHGYGISRGGPAEDYTNVWIGIGTFLGVLLFGSLAFWYFCIKKKERKEDIEKQASEENPLLPRILRQLPYRIFDELPL
jgi:hypothetical protein